VVNERSARIIELLFHHLVVIGAFLVTFLSAKFLYIIVFGLIMEVNRYGWMAKKFVDENSVFSSIPDL
jgi:hypothetical protein